MILELIESAVEIKIHYENFTGILQSDYELGYALGKMTKILGLPKEEAGFSLDDFKEKIEGEMKKYGPKDYIEKNLMRIIDIYRIQHQPGNEVYEMYEIGYKKGG